MNEYFDNIYVLNLHYRKERMLLSQKRLSFMDLKYERFGAVDGGVFNHLHKKLDNPYFTNPNYVACATSHLSIYHDALKNGYNRILILEDDNRINMNLHSIWSALNKDILDASEVMYLGFIPLSDDCSVWTYEMVSEKISDYIYRAKNFWGLYAYSPSRSTMEELLDTYNNEFPMEIDRYFVSKIQPRGYSIGISPQLFAADDGPSDNSGKVEMEMIVRSTDGRFSRVTDYI